MVSGAMLGKDPMKMPLKWPWQKALGIISSSDWSTTVFSTSLTFSAP